MLRKDAILTKYKDVPDEQKEMVYCEDVDGYNEGYFADIEDLIEYCEGEEIDIPEYVYSTTLVELSLNAYSILADACENLHEDAYDNLCDIEELQNFMNEWCKKQSGANTYEVNYNYVIKVLGIE